MTALIAGTDEEAVTEPVMTEVLAGARDDRREHDLRRLLDLALDGYSLRP